MGTDSSCAMVSSHFCLWITSYNNIATAATPIIDSFWGQRE